MGFEPVSHIIVIRIRNLNLNGTTSRERIGVVGTSTLRHFYSKAHSSVRHFLLKGTFSEALSTVRRLLLKGTFF